MRLHLTRPLAANGFSGKGGIGGTGGGRPGNPTVGSGTPGGRKPGIGGGGKPEKDGGKIHHPLVHPDIHMYGAVMNFYPSQVRASGGERVEQQVGPGAKLGAGAVACWHCYRCWMN